MTKPTPIEALRQRAVAAHAMTLAHDGDFAECEHPGCTDAREALGQVAALVASVRQRPCLGVARDGSEDECLVSDAPPGLWCWRCAALGPFRVQP